MSTTFRGAAPKLMLKDLYKWAFESYNEHPAVYSQIYRVENSDTGIEQNTTGIGMGMLSERPEGNDIVESNMLEGFTVYGKNRTFSDEYSMTAEFVSDTPIEKIANVMQKVASTWGSGVIRSKETFAALPFNYGGLTAGHDVFNNSTSYFTDPTGNLMYDGKPFFNLSGNARASKKGGTYYNGVALNLSATNIQTVYNLMTNTNNRNERDEVIAIMPNTLLIPTSLRFTARTILESDNAVGSANNDINAAKNLVKPIEWHYLTDTDAWFMMEAQRGKVWQERQAFVIDFFQNPTNKKWYATIDARWGLRIENWRYDAGSNFATS